MKENKNTQALNFSTILYPEDETHMQIIEELNKGAYSYAYALHDKDTDDQGEIKKPHYHVIIRFTNYKSRNKLAQELGLNISHILPIKYLRGAIRYLLHLDNEDKYQYPIDIIQSNFDHSDHLRTEKSESKKISEIIDVIYNLYPFGFKAILDEVIRLGLWSEYRRGYTIFKDLVNEIKFEEERKF
ncbi:MAG: Rep family protein [Sulfolobaceae archaeon]